MRVLSLRQPWAWAVVHGGKTVENRRWRTEYRGEFLIHASQGMTRQEYAEARKWIEDVRYELALPAIAFPAIEQLDRGGIMGAACIVGCLAPQVRPGTTEALFAESSVSPWHMPEQYGFLLTGVAPIEFHGMAARLGLFEWEPPPNVAAQVEAWRATRAAA